MHRFIRQIVTPDSVEGGQTVTCPHCKREDFLSGGWPGIEFNGDWKTTCDCGQPLLVSLSMNDPTDPQ